MIDFEDARNYHEMMMARIRSHWASDPRQAKKLIRRYFQSPAAKLYAAYRVLGQRPPEIIDDRRTVRVAQPVQCARSLQRDARRQVAHERRIQLLVERIGLFARTREIGQFWRIEKRNHGGWRTGRYRVVCSLGPRLRAQHLMIKDVLGATLVPRPHIFDVRGRGRDREARSILAAMQDGYRWAFVGDVENSFPSFSNDALNRLPLPRSVVRWNLIPSNLQLRHCAQLETEAIRSSPLTAHSVLGGNGRCGLLQGSSASNLIQAWIFNEVHTACSPDCRLFILSDNVLVLGRSEEAVQEAGRTLREHFARHPSGPFCLRGEFFHPIEDIDRCGYQYGRGPAGGGPATTIPENRFDILILRLLDALQSELELGKPFDEALDLVILRRRSGYLAISHPDIEWRAIRERVIEQYENPAPLHSRRHAG